MKRNYVRIVKKQLPKIIIFAAVLLFVAYKLFLASAEIEVFGQSGSPKLSKGLFQLTQSLLERG